MPTHIVTGMGLVRYILVITALATALAVLVVMAQTQYGNAQSTVNTQGVNTNNALSMGTTNITQVINCTQYGEFQGEFQCGGQVGIQTNTTAYNVTGGLPYQYEDEIEYESSIED